MHRSFQLSLALLAAWSALPSCSFLSLGMKQEHGLGEVDELLSQVERVQVEAAVSKERALAALEKLHVLLAPEFKGDAVVAHKELVQAVDASKEQAGALQDNVQPLRRTAESVFERWTADLESFGNLSLRQRSQERLEETRRRYDAILAAAVAAQLAYDAYNSDLSDQALFLEHDFNATSVSMIAGEMDGLKTRGKELGRRLDACAAACQAYVEFSAPKGEVAAEVVAPPSSETQPAEAAPALKKAPPKKKVMAKQGPAPAPAPTPTGPQGS